MVVAQNENYIKTTTYKVPTATSITTPAITQANQNITYFDGLGRPIQQIAHQQSGSGKDIVTPIEYDSIGRKTKDYLPYVPNTSASLDYKPTALIDVLNYPQYSGQNPYSEKLLETSPLNRVLKQAAPGTDWALNSGHEIKFEYQTNTITDTIKLFSVTANWDIAKGLYDIPTLLTSTDYLDFQLYKTITFDENTAATPIESNGSTVEFKNKEGQMILKRTYESGMKHDTYYVYDQFGNLTFVIPPLVNSRGTITQTILDDLCYQYKYDYRNRLVEKKIPGKQWEFIVYDKLDRPVATGPAFSPYGDSTIGWLITKYDIFNRPIYTGWYTATVTATTRTSLQNDQNNLTTANYESKSSSGTIDGITAYYTNTVSPTSFKLLTVNYYDDYNFPSAPSPVPTSVLSDNSQAVYYNNTQKPIGLPTGSWVRILQTPTDTCYESSYILYDSKSRPVTNYTTSYTNIYLSGFTKTEIKYDFIGKTTRKDTNHKRSAFDAQILINESFTYTPQDRLLTHTHQINNGVVQLLASNTYDELGKLISKNVGNTTAAPFQKVDYTYNIRGWLTGINNDPTNNLVLNTNETDLFAFKINYNTTEGNVTAVKSLYNGNISETYYRTSSDNVLRKYGYEYDNLNRLKNAISQKPGGNTYPTYEDYSEKNITYDKNGNIQTLYRNGDLANALPVNQIDDLHYSYKLNSNILTGVYDNSGNTSGFKDSNTVGDDYGYDANGNMVIDKNKNITSIVYNHLNLPTKITFGTTGNIVYIYNSIGQKLEKIVTGANPSIVTKTNYLGGFQYQSVNGSTMALQIFPTAEGYVKNTAGVYKYAFNYTDHLGNIRLSYAKNPTTGVLEILEENNYYPFGLKHKGYNDYTPTTYKYKYQGQERQDELGLNWDSFKWRNYDYAIGRFMNIDPLAPDFPQWSPYVFSGNLVTISKELEGLEPTFLIGEDGKLTSGAISLLQAAYGYSSASLQNSVWVSGLDNRVADAITLENNVFYADKFKPADDKYWIGLIAHEQSHRNEVDENAVDFYVKDILQWTLREYTTIDTEATAFKNGSDDKNPNDYADQLVGYNKGEVMSIFKNGGLTNNEKASMLESTGARFRRDVILKDKISSANSRLATIKNEMGKLGKITGATQKFYNKYINHYNKIVKDSTDEQEEITDTYGY